VFGAAAVFFPLPGGSAPRLFGEAP
jgi:hypothetical protein